MPKAGECMTPQQAVKLRKDLRRQAKRAHELAARLMAQTADADLASVDRETAEKRALLAIKAAEDLEVQIDRINEALSA